MRQAQTQHPKEAAEARASKALGVCRARREGDEMVCPLCGLRWGAEEEKPSTAKCVVDASGVT